MSSASRPPRAQWSRKIKAGWRDTSLLLREFQKPLLLFIFVIVGSGLFYFYLARLAGSPLTSRVESIYLALSMTFLQPFGEFPGVWYLQFFYFFMPVVGIGILAQGLADFGVLFFNRRARGKEWEMAVASTYSNHIVLIGMGHLGFRVALQLVQMERDVVVIEQTPKAELAAALRSQNIPIIEQDAARETALVAAGIRSARAIVLCTQNDVLNLQIALKARSLNPEVQVVVRIFDNDFAQLLHSQFGFTALSATGMAAPVFAATASGIDITPPITIEGTPNSLARLKINPRSHLAGKTVGEIEKIYDLSVVMLSHDGLKDLHPVGSLNVVGTDVIAVLGNPDAIAWLANDCQT